MKWDYLVESDSKLRSILRRYVHHPLDEETLTEIFSVALRMDYVPTIFEKVWHWDVKEAGADPYWRTRIFAVMKSAAERDASSAIVQYLWISSYIGAPPERAKENFGFTREWREVDNPSMNIHPRYVAQDLRDGRHILTILDKKGDLVMAFADIDHLTLIKPGQPYTPPVPSIPNQMLSLANHRLVNENAEPEYV